MFIGSFSAKTSTIIDKTLFVVEITSTLVSRYMRCHANPSAIHDDAPLVVSRYLGRDTIRVSGHDTIRLSPGQVLVYRYDPTY